MADTLAARGPDIIFEANMETELRQVKEFLTPFGYRLTQLDSINFVATMAKRDKESARGKRAGRYWCQRHNRYERSPV